MIILGQTTSGDLLTCHWTSWAKSRHILARRKTWGFKGKALVQIVSSQCWSKWCWSWSCWSRRPHWAPCSESQSTCRCSRSCLSLLLRNCELPSGQQPTKKVLGPFKGIVKISLLVENSLDWKICSNLLRITAVKAKRFILFAWPEKKFIIPKSIRPDMLFRAQKNSSYLQ